MRALFRVTPLVFSFMAFDVAGQPSPPPARFCIGAPGTDLFAADCRNVTADAIEVSPETKTRAWAHLDGARKLLTLGTLPPDATTVTFAAKPAALLSVTGVTNRDWPVATTLTLAQKAAQWTVTIPRNEITTLRAIALADGTYDVRIAAPHHFPLERKGTKFSVETPVLLSELRLQPLPRLRGTFADKEGNPLADVRVTTPDGKLLATSGATGEIAEELQERLPERLFARRDGFAHKTIELSKAADVDLGRVVMTAGATLTIDVDRNDYAGALTASLIRTHEHVQGNRTTFASQQIDGQSSQIVLHDLEARDYILILRGEEPLQTILLPLTLGSAEKKSMSVSLDASSVRGAVHRGAGPYENGAIAFSSGNGEWFAEAKTDGEGRFTSEAWFKGDVSVTVAHTPGSAYRTVRTVSAPVNEWDIALPDRKITGIVVEKATGKPLPNALLMMRYELQGPPVLGGATSMKVREDGTFELDLLEPGSFDFEARLEPFLPKQERVELTAADRERRVRLELEEGIKVRVQVQDASGRPPAGAELMSVRTDRRRPGGRWPVDATGAGTVILQADEVKTVWALTPQDTFAQFTVRASESGTRPVTVSLPPPVATLVVRAVREDGTPVPGVHIFMRHNGVFLDDDVRSYFGARRGTPMRTGSDGTIALAQMPAGAYELWGWETPSMHVGSDGRPMGDVARINALAGPNEVRLVMKVPQEK
ncbi:MAG TPA: hypothetical protein VGF69_13840 [Thermoanaerobaculia bacterium]